MDNAQRHIKVIAENLLSQRCIILLGPELCLGPNGEPFQEELLKQLESQNDLDFVRDTDFLVRFKEAYARQSFISELKSFYRSHSESEEIHDQLARIPGHVYVSFTPDLKLRRAFEKQGIAHRFSYYYRLQSSSDLPEVPSQNQPYIYNLFGSFEEELSLVLTYDDLFEFLFSILGIEHKLPRELRIQLNEARMFLFLGFKFDIWYLKLILRLLNVHLKELVPISTESTFCSNQIDPIKAFYVDNFEMQFLSLNPRELVNDLFQYFEQMPEKDQVLRNSSNNTTPEIIKEVKNAMRKDDLSRAFDLLDEHLEGRYPNLMKELIRLEGRYVKNERQKRNGTILQELYMVELNQIREGVMGIMGQFNHRKP